MAAAGLNGIEKHDRKMLSRSRAAMQVKKGSKSLKIDLPSQPIRQEDKAIERYAAVILAAIKTKYATTSFTRDDILTLVSQMRLDSQESWAASSYGMNDVSTGTRYRKVCKAVQYLIARKQLSALDWLRFCLPSMFIDLAAEVPPQVLYLPTVRQLVKNNFKSETLIDAMMVVRKWRSDQHVPENIKRMVVRGVFPLLAKEKILQRKDFNQFVVR